MPEVVEVRDVTVATTDYVGSAFFRTRLMPEGMRRDRLDAGIVRLTDQHISFAAKPKPYAVLTDMRVEGDEYRADWDIPITASNASYIEDRDAGLTGLTFSIGAEIFDVLDRGQDPSDGAYLMDVTSWEPIEVVDTPVPGDSRAIARSVEGAEEDVYRIGNLVVTSRSRKVLDLLQRSFGRTQRTLGGNMPEETEKVNDSAEVGEAAQRQAESEPAPTPGGDSTQRQAEGVPLPTPGDDSAQRQAEGVEQRTRDTGQDSRIAALERNNREQRDAAAAAGERSAMVHLAQRAGLSLEAAEQEVTEAITRGESRAAYAERKVVEIARTVNVIPQPFGSIQRDGFQGIDLGRYVDAVAGRERRDAGHEIEFAKLAREHYDSWTGMPIPFAAVMPVAEQRVLYSDVSGAIDLMVDMENAVPFFAAMEPWLDWVTMVSMGIGSGAFQLPIDGGVDPAGQAAVEGAVLTESDPDIGGAPMNALTVASYHTIGSGAFATGGPALSMFMREIFQSFVKETFGAQILNGSGSSGQISGVWGKLTGATRNHNYGAAVANFDYEDITAVYGLVQASAAYGMNEGWVLSPTLEAVMLAKQPFTNAGRAIAQRQVSMGMGVGEVLGAGMYASTRSMAVASIVHPGIYGLWSRCIVPIWGTAFELIEQEQAKNNFREYSVRLYANMQLANTGAFARIKQT